MTHWQLEDNTPVEIINFIDDYSRAVLCSSVVSVAKAADVTRLFYQAADKYGFPASVLSYNGAIYTNVYRGGHSALEIDLGVLGITFKHGKPYHPQTQGKVCEYVGRAAPVRSDPGQGMTKVSFVRALPPDPKEVAPQAAPGPEHRATPSPDRWLRAHLQRGASPPSARMSADTRVAHPGQSDALIAGQRIDAKTRVRYDLVESTGKVTIRYKR
jgi:transposase InsO family protein